jgi:hypothetical protein
MGSSNRKNKFECRKRISEKASDLKILNVLNSRTIGYNLINSRSRILKETRISNQIA